MRAMRLVLSGIPSFTAFVACLLLSALAARTERIQLRAGSLVSPLHDTIRVFEDWSVLDHLSRGRCSLSFGSGWNVKSNNTQDSQLETLPSAGVGLIFDPDRHVHAQIYWGYAFNRSLVPSGDNLQDYGIHFFISVNAF